MSSKNIVNVSKPSIVNFQVEENSQADRRVNLAGFNPIQK